MLPCRLLDSFCPELLTASPCDCSSPRTGRKEWGARGEWAASPSRSLGGRTPCLSSHPSRVRAFPPHPEEPSAKRGFSLPLQGPGRPRMGEPTQEEPQAGVLGTASLPEPLRLYTSRGGLSGMRAVTIIRLVTSTAPRQALLLPCPLTHPKCRLHARACCWVLGCWVGGCGEGALYHAAPAGGRWEEFLLEAHVWSLCRGTIAHFRPGAPIPTR